MSLVMGIIKHQTAGNDGKSGSQIVVCADKLPLKMCTFVEKTHGSVAVVTLMFIYLPGSIASKDGKTDIGDTLVKESNSRPVAYLQFLYNFPFEPCVLLKI